jgi:TrmH family RNA methyltransferase
MSEAISSLQNNRVKLVYQLQNKARIRRSERKIVLEGTRLVVDALSQNHRPSFIFYEPSKVDYELIAQIQNTRATLYEVTAEIMQHVSDTQNPQGILAVFPIPEPILPKQPKRILILDAIREPGNMGTILRTAGAAAVQLVILAPNCVDPYNSKVLRSGMGAHFRVPIIEASWQEIRAYCAEIQAYLAAGDGDKNYSEVDWTESWALVIGNEAHGVGEKAESIQGERISIPMATSTESINAAVATGVILFEAQRQITLKKYRTPPNEGV